MPTRHPLLSIAASTAWPLRRSVSCALLSAALGTAGSAEACTLESLLRLPLERLLELRIGGPRPPQGGPVGKYGRVLADSAPRSPTRA